MALFPLPHTTRSQVFNALFALIQTVPIPSELNVSNWGTTSQHLKIWDDVPNQPAIFLYRGAQTAEQKKAFGVTRWQWRAFIYIYYKISSLQCAGNDEFPESLVDTFVDNIEQTFQTEPLDGRLTLGGLVHHVWIDGTILFDSGIVDTQAVLIVPLSILI